MRPTFDLIHEPWIPCLALDGTPQELGLFDVLRRASAIRGIFDPSPPVVASLHRLLLAILHRLFGPENLSAWKRVWGQRRWDEGTLKAYFRRWRERFDLFHPEHPFYQVTSLPARTEEATDGYNLLPISKLALELASGNNPTLFDHSADDNPAPVSPPTAARLVVACQAFHLGGLVSRLKSETASAAAAPLAKGAVVQFQGENLFETLMHNLIAYSVKDGEPFAAQTEEDGPAWEKEATAEAIQRPPLGYLDYLTWQSMRIKLFPEGAGPGLAVRYVLLAAGTRLSDDWLIAEPQFAYRKNPESSPSAGDQPWRPLRFQPDRVLWRDSTALITAGTEHEKPPRASGWLGRLVRDGTLSHAARYRLRICGLSSRQAKVDFWRDEFLPVPAAYLADDDLVGLLRDAVALAEKAGEIVFRTLKKLPDVRERDRAGRQRRTRLPDPVIAPGLAWYWSSLDYPFHVLLEDLPSAPDAVRRRWATTLRSAGRQSFDRAARGLEHKGRFLKEVTEARRDLDRGLAALIERYEEGVPHDDE